MTITRQTLGQALDAYPSSFSQNIVRQLDDPLYPSASLIVLQGNLSPNGCVLKQSAMSPALRKHRGRAVVFESAADLMDRIDDPNLDVTADSV